jgi:6-phosphogluconolactonase (cycloisomerase 2 family)
MYIAGGEIFVANYDDNSIRVFPTSADGDVAPTRVLMGASTGISFPAQSAVFRGELYVSNYNDGAIRVYPVGASGNTAPTRTITGLSGPLAVFVY